MADEFFTLDEIKKQLGVPIPLDAAPGVPAAPVPPGYFTPGDILRQPPPEEYKPPEGETSGYLAMQPAVAGRTIAGTIGGPIDAYRWAKRGMEGAVDKEIGGLVSKLPPPSKAPSAVSGLEKALGVDKYKPTDSFEKMIFDAETAAAGSLLPFGVGRVGMGLGAVARGMASSPASRLALGGDVLTTGGKLLTAGGPGTAMLTGAGAEMGGEMAAHYAPEGYEDAARLGGNLIGGGVVALPFSGAKTAAGAVTSKFPGNAERLAQQTARDEIGPSAIPALEGTPGAPGFNLPSIRKTAEEVVAEAHPGMSTGITDLDAYARKHASRNDSLHIVDSLGRRPGENIYDVNARERDLARQQHIQAGTNITGGSEDPFIGLATKQAGLANPGARELALQADARAAQAGLPTRTAVEAEEGVGQHLTNWHSDSLRQQTAQKAEVGRLLTELESHPNPLLQDFKNKVETKDPVTRAGTGGVDQGKYQKWIDDHRDVLTPDEFRQLTTIGAAHQELGNLTKQTEQYAKQFPVRPGGDYAGMADKYVGTGAIGASRAKDFNALTGGDPAAAGDLFDFRMAQWRGEKGFTNADGSINHEKLKELMTDNKGWLDQMPSGLTGKLTNYHDAQKLFDDVATTRTQALKDFEKSSVAPYLSFRDTNLAMHDLLNNGNKVNNFRDIMGQLRGNPTAQNGLRRNFMEYGGKNHFETPIPGDPAGRTAFNPEGFQTFFRENEGVIKELYGRTGYAALKRVNDDITSSLASEARRTRAAAGVPERMQGYGEGTVGKAVETGLGWLGSKFGFGGTAATSIITGIALGNVIPPATLHTIQGGAWVHNLIKNQQRRGVNTATDRLAELMNNPKALALSMREAPTDPKSPFYTKLAGALGSAAVGVAGEKITHEPGDVDIPGVVMPRLGGMLPGIPTDIPGVYKR